VGERGLACEETQLLVQTECEYACTMEMEMAGGGWCLHSQPSRSIHTSTSSHPVGMVNTR
jgi:hypothetical protein